MNLSLYVSKDLHVFKAYYKVTRLSFCTLVFHLAGSVSDMNSERFDFSDLKMLTFNIATSTPILQKKNTASGTCSIKKITYKRQS